MNGRNPRALTLATRPVELLLMHVSDGPPRSRAGAGSGTGAGAGTLGRRRTAQLSAAEAERIVERAWLDDAGTSLRAFVRQLDLLGTLALDRIADHEIRAAIVRLIAAGELLVVSSQVETAARTDGIPEADNPLARERLALVVQLGRELRGPLLFEGRRYQLTTRRQVEDARKDGLEVVPHERAATILGRVAALSLLPGSVRGLAARAATLLAEDKQLPQQAPDALVLMRLPAPVQTVSAAVAEPVAPRPRAAPAPPPEPEPAPEPAPPDPTALIQALRAAAQRGAAFCEECEQALRSAVPAAPPAAAAARPASPAAAPPHPAPAAAAAPPPEPQPEPPPAVAAQIQVLRDAAEEGIPFCEECQPPQAAGAAA